MSVLCVCSKEKGVSQDNRDKEISTENVQRENERRSSEKNSGWGKYFRSSQNVQTGPEAHSLSCSMSTGHFFR